MTLLARFQPFFAKAHFGGLSICSTSSIQIRHQITQQVLPPLPAKCPPIMMNFDTLTDASATFRLRGTGNGVYGALLTWNTSTPPSIPIKFRQSGISIPPSRIRTNISVPHLYQITPFENPSNNPGMDRWIEDPLKKPEVTDIGTPSQVEKQAARLIVIRRTKMNKHKLRKLRKRMKYVFAKIRLRREIRKEKAFLNVEMAKIREAQKFDAKAYVADILLRAKEELLPTRFEGKYYPPSMIREKLEVDEKRKRQEYLSILDKRKSEKQ